MQISSFVSQTVGYHLVGSGMLEFCLHVLQTLLDVCKTSAGHDVSPRYDDAIIDDDDAIDDVILLLLIQPIREVEITDPRNS